MKQLVSELLVLFAKTDSLTNRLDPSKSHIMVFSLDGASQYSVETYLRIEPLRAADDTGHHSIAEEALSKNYTGASIGTRFSDKPALNTELGRLRRFDLHNYQTQLWFDYTDGKFTHLAKGVVYVAADSLAVHIAKVTTIVDNRRYLITIVPKASDKWVPPYELTKCPVAERRKSQLKKQGAAV
jgi:hypothetical protein